MFTDEQYTYLVKKYIDTVFRVALNYLKNRADAEDICQDVFLKLLQQKKPFDSEEHLRNWLIRVTINACKNVLRSPWHRRESLDDHVPVLEFTKDGRGELYYAVMELPVHYRVPLYLYYYEGYSTQEIASILGMPKNTVCTRLNRARQLLRKELEEVPYEV